MEATLVSWEHLPAALSESDIVITATGASIPIISRHLIATTMRSRRHRPLFLIDIAVPRDVEATAGAIEQVFLYNIDDLQATVRENMARRAGEVARAESIVGEEVEKFGTWLRSRGAVPTIVALRQHFETIRRAEVERLLQLSSLPPEARERVNDISRLIVEKLLLTPTEQLKSVGDQEIVGAYHEALTRLFGLGAQTAPSSPGGPGDPGDDIEPARPKVVDGSFNRTTRR
jgi:glutamyl-tRNA reductase